MVTLSTKDNVKLIKEQSDGLKRSIYWNKYQSNVWTEKLETILIL